MGYSGEKFTQSAVKISFLSGAGSILVCEAGEGVSFDEVRAKEILSEEEVTIVCRLKDGAGEAEAFGCDLTYDYVKINGDYRT
jgi:glutamate N-acetyltransferase/amino-acid N-acetyltransferase